MYTLSLSNELLGSTPNNHKNYLQPITNYDNSLIQIDCGPNGSPEYFNYIDSSDEKSKKHLQNFNYETKNDLLYRIPYSI